MRVEYCNEIDIELWCISRDGWCIPMRTVYCTLNGSDAVHVTPAMFVGFPQTEAIDQVIRQTDGIKLRSGWVIPTEKFHGIATKAKGITPEFYYYWHGPKAFKGFDKPPEEIEDTRYKAPDIQEDFLDLVSQRSGIPTASLTMAWLAILQVMPDWLLSGKTLDLGFCRLLALPYRRNWKELLLARYPTFRKLLMVRDKKRLMSLAFTAASRMIRTSELSEYRTKGGRSLFAWSIELIHDSSWENASAEVESKAADALGPIPYVKRWAAKIGQLEDQIYEIIAQHVTKENTSCCRLFWRRGNRGVRFVEGAPTIVSHRASLDSDEDVDQSVDDFVGIEERAEYLEAAAARMLSLPNEESEVDMRLPRRDGDNSGGDAADSRVLVLPATSGEASGEGMLAPGDGNEGG